MGIKGLTSFLDCHSKFLTDFKLRDTRVIIDGNNLFHFLNELYGVDDNFGGNYDCFALATHGFFSTLHKCNVTALVLFDGPYIPSENKIGTSVKRARERINYAQQLSLGSTAQRITPILCQDVFITCLNMIGVQHITCEDEADDDIAALANECNCPVMTNDSDFFIFNIRAGVILLDYVNLKIRYATEQLLPNQSERYIKVQIYYSHKLMEAYNLDVDKLALFGTVLGNDRVDNRHFVNFFAKTHLPCSNGGRGHLYSKRKKIDRFLQWLRTAGTLDEAIGKILSSYQKDAASQLRKVIEDSVSSYRSINLHYITISDGLLRHTESQMVTIVGHPLPAWLMDELHRGRLSTIVTNTITCRKVILLAQPENFSMNSAHDCSKLLRHFIYGMLVQYDAKFHDFHKSGSLQCSETCATTVSKNSLVTEMDRDGRSQKSTVIQPLLVLDDKTIPSLHEIEDLTHEEKLNWLYLACGLRSDSSVVRRSPKGLELFLLCLSYWISHADPKVDILHLTSVIICLLKLGALDSLSKQNETKHNDPPPENNNTPTEVDPEAVANKLSTGTLKELIKQSCSQEEIIAAKQSLDAFKQETMSVKKKRLAVVTDINILHVFAQLQSCMQAIQALNEVLGSPLRRISVSHVFSGLFLFFCYRDIRARKDYDGYLFHLLKKCKMMLEVVLCIRHIVTDSVNETAVLAETPHVVKSTGKKKKLTNQKNVEVHQEASQGEEDSSEDDPLTFQKKFLPECDINNRFGCLKIES